MGHGDIVLKLHVWIPHGKIADAYFWFSLNYLPLLNYGPLTNKGMKFCKCRISKSIIARNLEIVSADSTGVNQKVLPVLSTETLLHIWLSTEYYGFRPSSTVVDTGDTRGLMMSK